MKLCFSNEDPVFYDHSIFLAGPTRRNSPYDLSWRKEAVDILKKYKYDGIVYIPEYSEGSVSEFDLNRQIHWEWDCLDAADVILFWIPRSFPDMPALTTNVEFGIYTEKKPNSIILGYPDDASKMTYLLERYRTCTERNKCDTLEETILNSIKRLEELK